MGGFAVASLLSCAKQRHFRKMTITINANQVPADVAVVITSVLRPSLLEAVRSVFRQRLSGRIHLLIGIDIAEGERSMLDQIRAECPPHVSLTILDLGYSTAQRHGGIETNAFGGAIPNILSLMANSRYIAYLDDDDWWASDHLASMMQAIAGKQWAFAYRWMVHPETLWPICRDEWDAVGPGRGINNDRYGGFVAPSGLMLDKQACHSVLRLWNHALFQDGGGNDRRIFAALNKGHTWAASGRYTVYYVLGAAALREAHHAREFAQRGINWAHDPMLIDAVRRHAADARENYERCDLMTAADLARAALAINPNHADTLHCLAQIETAAGQYSAALQHIRHALSVDDRIADYRATLDRILRASGQAAEADAVPPVARPAHPGQYP
jgi:tetratricopeptide (TPR) repeat protein